MRLMVGSGILSNPRGYNRETSPTPSNHSKIYKAHTSYGRQLRPEDRQGELTVFGVLFLFLLIDILCPLLGEAYLVWETGPRSSRLWGSKAESQWKGPYVDDTVQTQHFQVLKNSLSLQLPYKVRATLKRLQMATELGLLHRSVLDEDR